jgi:hypothetical protein
MTSVSHVTQKGCDVGSSCQRCKKGDERDMSMLSSSLVINFGAQNRPVQNGFIEILDGPTGFMVIKRSVFKTLEEKFPELVV